MMTITGSVVPLVRPDIDTDQLLPKQFLSRLESSGYGPYLLFDWRKDPQFVLNDDRFTGGTVLVAGRNFGCGSSREQAVWAIRDYGFRAVIAPSFSSIFQANCIRNGVLAARASVETCAELARRAYSHPGEAWEVDLIGARITSGDGQGFPLSVPESAQRSLVEEMDDVEHMLRQSEAVAAYEARIPEWVPRTTSVDL